ncbi:MAG: trypsin-like peptidase domain-containing protein [Planctomycetota bacterium]
MDSSNQAEQLQRRLTLTWILLALIAIVFVWPTVKAWLGFGAAGVPRTITPRGDLAEFEKTTMALFESVSPSVVYLTTRARVDNPFSLRSLEVEAGSGSGFMWDEAGHIVTNYHVLQNASSARVFLFDQSSYEATTVGSSADHDLAVLRIRAPAALLRPVPVGESHDLRVGQAVFAIGNPFGLDQTLTTGVVSAKSRTIQGPSGRSIEEVIQIDAAINPGNSGGPLLDSAGRLIGVNSAIYSPSGASAGVGFAIPVDTVNRVVPQIIANGRYEPPQLGVHVRADLSTAVTQRLGVEGVLIHEVVPGSGAATAGLRGVDFDQGELTRLGDIIQKIGDHPVASMNDLLAALEDYNRDDEVAVEYLRDCEVVVVDVRLQ